MEGDTGWRVRNDGHRQEVVGQSKTGRRGEYGRRGGVEPGREREGEAAALPSRGSSFLGKPGFQS